jgi:glutathione S-transferase
MTKEESISELQIIGAPQSNYVWVVRIACHEKGVPYTLVPVMPHTPDVDAIHPLGKIPALRHGNVRIAESRAICSTSIICLAARHWFRATLSKGR